MLGSVETYDEHGGGHHLYFGVNLILVKGLSKHTLKHLFSKYESTP